MINNRQQNGRRRGRGGQRTQGGGNPGRPDNGNRIDSRARGNAAQLLEKYKNLARDAQMQGDRVNTEYYLQFADHYFRVLSESRARFEEQNPQARRPQQDGVEDGFENGYDAGFGGGEDYGDEGEPVRADQYQPRRDAQRDDRGDDQQERSERHPRFDRQDRPERQNRSERQDGQDRREMRDRQPRRERTMEADRVERAPREQFEERLPRTQGDARESLNGGHAGGAPAPDAVTADLAETAPPAEAPRKRGRPRRVAVEDGGAAVFDAAVLPPALGLAPSAGAESGDEDKPRRRRGRPPAAEPATVS